MYVSAADWHTHSVAMASRGQGLGQLQEEIKKQDNNKIKIIGN